MPCHVGASLHNSVIYGGGEGPVHCGLAKDFLNVFFLLLFGRRMVSRSCRKTQWSVSAKTLWLEFLQLFSQNVVRYR